MKLIYDASVSLLPLAGVGRYATELLRAVIAEWPEKDPPPRVWLNSWRRHASPRHHDFLKQAVRAGRIELHWTRIPGPLLLEGWRWLHWPPAERLAGPADVMHCPAGYLTPTRRAARVVTLHDLHYLRYPSHGARLGGRYLASTLPKGLPPVEAVIVPSHAVRGEVLTHFSQVKPQRVHVVPEGVNSERFLPLGPEAIEPVLRRRGIDQPYVLTVGTLEPRKNLERLFQAMVLWKARAANEKKLPLLVGVGRPGWGGVTVEGLCARARLDPQAVRWIDDAGDEELPALYGGARLVVIPSLWEGFGLPALEAMACGRPVAVSRQGALPEVVGKEGTLFDPLDIQEMASALEEIFLAPEERREEMGKRARARAREFTWADAARRTLEVYREAVGTRTG